LLAALTVAPEKSALRKFRLQPSGVELKTDLIVQCGDDLLREPK